MHLAEDSGRERNRGFRSDLKEADSAGVMSVTDKTGLVEFAQVLAGFGVELVFDRRNGRGTACGGPFGQGY